MVASQLCHTSQTFSCGLRSDCEREIENLPPEFIQFLLHLQLRDDENILSGSLTTSSKAMQLAWQGHIVVLQRVRIILIAPE